MKNKKEYTAEETASFKASRQKPVKNRAITIWDSTNKGTFRGSIRQQFTGEKRCGISLKRV